MSKTQIAVTLAVMAIIAVGIVIVVAHFHDPSVPRCPGYFGRLYPC